MMRRAIKHCVSFLLCPNGITPCLFASRITAIRYQQEHLYRECVSCTLALCYVICKSSYYAYSMFAAGCFIAIRLLCLRVLVCVDKRHFVTNRHSGLQCILRTLAGVFAFAINLSPWLHTRLLASYFCACFSSMHHLHVYISIMFACIAFRISWPTYMFVCTVFFFHKCT